MTRNKASQQVLLSRPEKSDILALALVRRESQAEVVRRLIDMALPRLMGAHGRAIGELFDALDSMGVDRVDALIDMTTVKVRADGLKRTLDVTDLQDGQGVWKTTYPGTLSAV